EVLLGSLLHRRGLRFRKNATSLPGKPDIVLPKFRAVIFVDGDFWHGRTYKKMHVRLTPFWREKIGNNIRRDRRQQLQLKKLGWIYFRVWETDLKKSPEKVAIKLISKLKKRNCRCGRVR